MATFTKLTTGWQVKIRRKGFPHLSKVFDLKSDATEWARIQETDIDKGVIKTNLKQAQDMSFHKLLETYCEQVGQEKKGWYWQKYLVRRWQEIPLSRYSLANLSPAEFVAYRDQRLRDGLKPATVNRELGFASAVINWARKELMLPINNPLSLVRRAKEDNARDRRFEGTEQERLIDALSNRSRPEQRADGKKYPSGSKNPWVLPIVQFAVETAMRRGEILSLTWNNVNTTRRTAFLPITKNGTARTVPLSSRALAVLDALPRPNEDDGSEGRVFPITPNALKLAFNRACDVAGLQDFHFHDLRHEAASRMATKLPNLIELSAVTGHKDLRMLKRYYHPRAEDLALKLG